MLDFFVSDKPEIEDNPQIKVQNFTVFTEDSTQEELMSIINHQLQTT
jgi:hypothetical protein